MKTEAEIRQHFADLQVLRRGECSCGGTEHEIGCYVGGRMMEAAAGALAWVLGENPHYEGIVERYRMVARDALDPEK
jgi:hypothetical protein